jgi:hypothetical protein
MKNITKEQILNLIQKEILFGKEQLLSDNLTKNILKIQNKKKKPSL